MTDLSHWDFAEVFDGYEAAALILGLEPRDSDGEQGRIRVVTDSMEQHYKNVLCRYQLKILCHEESSETRKIELESTSMGDLYHNFWLHVVETPFIDWLNNSRLHEFQRQTFGRYRIVSWLREIGRKSIYQFDLRTPIEATDVVLPNEPIASIWPWGAHHTEALGHLEAAANKFWRLYDPEDDSTAPTNKQVAEWLQSKRGLSQKMAEAMASILRADGLPTGPRK
jgi:hypothetical protein